VTLDDSVFLGAFDLHVIPHGQHKAGHIIYLGSHVDGSLAEFLRLYRHGKYLNLDVVDRMLPRHYFARAIAPLPQSANRPGVPHHQCVP
jgi:hypothetical protein